VLVSAWAPSITGNGSAIRAGVALEALAHDHDVDLVLAASYGPVAPDHWSTRLARAVHVLPIKVADAFLWRLDLMSESEQQRARVVYPRPLAAAFSTPQAAAAVVDAVGGDVDLFYVFRAFAAPLAEPWLSLGGRRPRFVLDVDEDDERTLRQIASMQRSSGDEAWADVNDADASRLSAMAAEWIPRADLVLAAGPEEVHRLGARYPDATIDLLPNPTPPTGDDGSAPDTDLLFVGTCSYPPNIDAARWLCLEVLPLLRRRLGRPVKVAVVGSTMVDSVSALAADPDVTVVADAPSVTPWYRATKVAVAPLRAGGGTRLKILEAFGHRRPVVSTSQGAEGLSVTPGVDILVGNTTEEFAAACADLLGDTGRRAALASAAVQIAVAHARPVVVDRLAGMLARRAVERAGA
jgi:glycosyltransferase involved in cell wall biosynthesis